MKTPEELAEEYANIKSDNEYFINKDAFIAGYKAAQEKRLHLCKDVRIPVLMQEQVDPVMEFAKQYQEIGFNEGYKAAQDHNADASKMVDVSASATLNNWISVKDRLPEINIGFIAFVENKEVCNCHRYNNNRKDSSPVFYAQTKSGLLICSIESITHWMPLPQPPEEEE